jgi:hypothetical protein
MDFYKSFILKNSSLHTNNCSPIKLQRCGNINSPRSLILPKTRRSKSIINLHK